MEKSMKNNKLHKIIISLFLCLAAFCAVSCDMINEPVKDFFTGAGKELGVSAGISNDKSSDNSNSTDNTEKPDNDNSKDKDDGGETTPVTPEINPGPVIPDDTEFDTIDTEVSFASTECIHFGELPFLWY